MITYLDELAKEIASKFPNPEKICLVLPSKRASTFLKKSLSEAYQKTIFAPQFYAQGEFVEMYSGLRRVDNLFLVLELYESYKKVEKEDPEDFESFLKWAPILLSDFADVDRYLIDPQHIFKYVNEARVIEFWNLSGEPMTITQENYLKFWKLMGDLYQQFTSDLKSKGISYQGLQYRIVAERIDKIEKELPFDHIVFAGFNALSTAEEKIIYGLVKSGKASIYWDSDEYYMADNAQEAGRFLRRIREKRGNYPFNWISDHLVKSEKQVNIVNCNTNSGQVRYTGELLQSVYEKEKGLRTAVVLNDEELLLPLLYNLPSNIDAANITMGYSLKQTPMASFINSVISVWDNNRLVDGKRLFYFKPVFELLEHSYFGFLAKEKEEVDQFKKSLIKRNVIYISPSDFEAAFGKSIWIEVLLETKINIQEYILSFLELFSILKDHIGNSELEQLEQSLHVEYLYHYTTVFNQLNEVSKSYESFNQIGLRLFRKVIQQLVNGESLSFFGEPLKGLQIMGMLETRMLDFERIIVLSVNEGCLPMGKKQNSFIPFDIRREFELPTHLDHDAVFAHHFYRLLQRAKEIDLVYVSGAPDFGKSSEPSRFIEQLDFELTSKNSSAKIHHKSFMPEVVLNDAVGKVQVSEQVKEKIISILENKISPSALNTFIKCSKDFYYRYVLGLGEAEEIEENVQSSTFGTCVHETIEQLFEPYLKQPLKTEMIDKMKPLVQEIMTQRFLQFYTLLDLKSGNNFLSFEVAKEYVYKFLELEKRKIVEANTLGIVYTDLKNEQELITSVPVEVEGRMIEVKLRGFADRIGMWGSETQLIDYKTGKVDATDLNFKDWQELYTDAKKSKALQLAFYSYAYLKENPMVSNFNAGIYSFRNLKSGLLFLKRNKQSVEPQEILEEFPKVIQAIVDQMFQAQEYVHDEKSLYCNYCN